MGDPYARAMFELFIQLETVLSHTTTQARLDSWNLLIQIENQYGSLLRPGEVSEYNAAKKDMLTRWSQMTLSPEEREQVELMIKHRSGLEPVFEDPVVKESGGGAFILNPVTKADFAYNKALELGYASIEEAMKANEEWMKKYGFDECVKLGDPMSRFMCGFEKGFSWLPKAAVHQGGELSREIIDETGKTINKAGETIFGSPTMLIALGLGALFLLKK